jgi:hypothetical protein
VAGVILANKRVIHEALASTWRKPVSFRYCSRFIASTVHPRREINEFVKLVAASGELRPRANQTPVVVNNSGEKGRTSVSIRTIVTNMGDWGRNFLESLRFATFN